MGGDNFDKSSIGEIIDFYEADRLFREYMESKYDKLIWDTNDKIKWAASNGETSLMVGVNSQKHSKLPLQLQTELCAYFTKLGYDTVAQRIRGSHVIFTINWAKVDRRKFP